MDHFTEIRSGIYFLCQGKKVIYIGKSCDVQARVNGHSSAKEFDSVVSMLVPEALLDEVEQYWIKRIKPELNIRHHKKRDRRLQITRSYCITVPKNFLPVIKQMAVESNRSVSAYLTNLIKRDTDILKAKLDSTRVE